METINKFQVAPNWEYVPPSQSDLIKRIGSNSSNAMVFIDNTTAIKLLLEFENTGLNPKEEINFTTQLSNYKKNFPTYYNTKYCSNILIPRKIANVSLMKRAFDYAVKNKIRNILGNKYGSNRFLERRVDNFLAPYIANIKEQKEILYPEDEDKFTFYNDYIIGHYNFYYKELFEKMNQEDISFEPFYNISGYLMYFELGTIDVNNLLETPINLEMVKKICKEVLQGLEIMYKLGLSHNDLHIGNVMLFEDKFKIIDFGTIEQNNDKFLVDFSNFIFRIKDKLEEKKNDGYEKIINYLGKLFEIIDIGLGYDNDKVNKIYNI